MLPKDITDLIRQVNNLKSTVGNLEEQLRLYMSCPELRKHWTPKEDVLRYLGYGENQLATITKQYGIVTTKIGKRKFYSVASLIEIMNKNKM